MSIKKAELHVHLEGTTSPVLAYKLAKRNKLQIPEGLISADGQSYLSRDFLHFLQVYDTLAALIKTPRDYYDITYDYLRTNALEDTIYIEMMYSPEHAEQATGIPSIEHLRAIQQAVDDAKAEFGIIGHILVTAVRHFGSDAAIKVAKQIAKESVPCVTGFGLGGDEINYPPKLFRKAFQIAALEAGLPCTAHAGEFAPASGILEAIEHLHIQRIGHGVQAIHSKEVMSIIKERGIALEICPTSNIKLGLFKDYQSHPLPKFIEAGIKISINSDDPPFFATNLANEYRVTQSMYRYSDTMMETITAMAIECAFASQETKSALLAQLSINKAEVC